MIEHYIHNSDIVIKTSCYRYIFYCKEILDSNLTEPNTINIKIHKRHYDDGIFYFLEGAMESLFNESGIVKNIGYDYLKEEILTIRDFLEQWAVINL